MVAELAMQYKLENTNDLKITVPNDALSCTRCKGSSHQSQERIESEIRTFSMNPQE